MNTKLLKSMLVISVMGIATSVHASIVLVNGASPVTLNPGETATFSNLPTAGNFDDNYSFDLTGTGASGKVKKFDLERGYYDLVVTGDANGKNGGSYSGIVLAPVPLPAAAWLLLSGLVGVGAMARRRKIEGIDA